MGRLTASRPVFHLKADFQHAFTWELHRILPEGEFRSERKHARLGTRVRLDVRIALPGGSFVAVELK